MSEETACCGTCVHWRAFFRPDGTLTAKACRRFPPQIVQVSQGAQELRYPETLSWWGCDEFLSEAASRSVPAQAGKNGTANEAEPEELAGADGDGMVLGRGRQRRIRNVAQRRNSKLHLHLRATKT